MFFPDGGVFYPFCISPILYFCSLVRYCCGREAITYGILYTSKQITGQSSAWGAGKERVSRIRWSPCSMQDSPPSLPGSTTCRQSSRTLTERTMNASSPSIQNDARTPTGSCTMLKRWQDTWNTARPSYRIAIHAKTPLQILTMIHPHVFAFPVLLMEDVIKMFCTAARWFETYFKINLVRITGTYVLAVCKNIGKSTPTPPVPCRALFRPPLF